MCALPYPLPRSAGGRQGGGDLILTSGQILAGGQGDRGGEARDGAQAALLSGSVFTRSLLFIVVCLCAGGDPGGAEAFLCRASNHST